MGGDNDKMPINITTLNNDAAVAKTFTEIAKDKISGTWLNTTDSNSTKDSRMEIKQSLLGKNKSGQPVRRSLVQHKISVPTSLPGVSDEVTVNLTITRPVQSTVLAGSDVRDAVAYVRNLVNSGMVDALGQGQV